MGTNETINRLAIQDYGILRNPFFEGQYKAPGNSTAFSSPFVPYRRLSGLGNNAEVGPTPWRTFGSPAPFVALGTDAQFVLSDASIQEHPFYSLTPGNRSPIPGTSLGAFPGSFGGIVQRIPNGRQLLGKKVRITGAFRVQVQDPRVTGQVALGVSAWIKGAVHEATIRGNLLRSAAAAADMSAGSTAFNDPAESFLSDSISQGDMLFVMSPSGQEWFEIQSVVSDTQLQTKNPAVYDHAVGDTHWAIGRQIAGGGGSSTFQGNYISEQGIYIDVNKIGATPGHYVRVTDPAFTYDQGPEWLIRGRDAVRDPGGFKQVGGDDGNTATSVSPGDTLTSAGASFLSDIPNTAGTPDVDTWVYLSSQGSWYNVVTVVSGTELRIAEAATASLPPSGLTAQDYTVWVRSGVDSASQESSALSFMFGPDLQLSPNRLLTDYSVGSYPPYLTTGAPGQTDQAKVFFIDSSDWVSNPSGPTYKLADSLATDSTGVQYIDEIVEIPAAMTLDTDDLWLVLLPYDPSDYNNIPFPVSVALYAFQVEHIAEEQADASSRLEHAYLKNAFSYRSPYRTFSEQEIVRDPIYRLVRLPIEPRLARPDNSIDLTAGAAGDGDLRMLVLDAPDTVVRYRTVGGSKLLSPLLIPLPHLPAGSLLEEVWFDFNVTEPSGTARDLNVDIFEVFDRKHNMNPNTTNLVRPVSGTFVANGTGDFTAQFKYGNNQGDIGEYINRHRKGLPWAANNGVNVGMHSSGGTVTGEGLGSRWMRGSRYWLRLSPQLFDVWEIYLYGGFILAWVDPRMPFGDSGSSF